MRKPLFLLLIAVSAVSICSNAEERKPMSKVCNEGLRRASAGVWRELVSGFCDSVHKLTMRVHGGDASRRWS